MKNGDYIALARADNVWRETVGSFAIEGMVMAEDTEVIVGRMIAREIDVEEAIAIITANTLSKT